MSIEEFRKKALIDIGFGEDKLQELYCAICNNAPGCENVPILVKAAPHPAAKTAQSPEPTGSTATPPPGKGSGKKE
jgi:hypothetical protein